MNHPETAEQAEAVFYAAFQNGDLDAMAAVWDRSDEVACVHPQGPQLLGYERIMKSWERILNDTEGFRIEIELLHHHTDGDLSIHFVNEIVFNEHSRSEPVTLMATNAYRRTDSGWRIVLHHASPAPQLDEPRTVQEPDVTLH